jgi:putative SOS response-associated peptidase YedK
LADRAGARFSAPGAWGGAGSTALGLPAGEAQGRTGDQFPFRGAPVPERALPHPGVPFLRVHRQKPPKSKWKFTKTGEDWFCFAGLWRPMPDGAGDAFTILTTEPGADVTPIHNRQVVVLERADWLAWLDLTKPEPELLRPLPAGSLTVEQVR